MSRNIMIVKYPAYEEVNHHLKRLVKSIFDKSDYDPFSVRFDYIHGYIAEVDFVTLSLHFFQKGESANDATLKLLKRIRSYCKEEGLTIASVAEIIKFKKIEDKPQR